MRERPFLPADSAADAFGAPLLPRRSIPLARLLAGLVIVVVLAMLTLFSVRGWLHVDKLLHSCVGAGISTHEGREGQCERINGLFSQPTVYNVNGNGAPQPSIGLQRLIAPHASITAWATFVAPEWSRGLLSARPADLDLLRADDDSHYVGQMRLWK